MTEDSDLAQLFTNAHFTIATFCSVFAASPVAEFIDIGRLDENTQRQKLDEKYQQS
ncbi:MAG: hypothetical protein HY210_06200 [Candidatus Omnitrophica bacterium]|nr:hypothetical protein [Candidatus Omnitrophota bacterium]